MQTKLSEIPGVGQVHLCSHCNDVHVTVGALSGRLSKEVFLAVCQLFRQAQRHPLFSEGEGSLFTLTFENDVPRFETKGCKRDE